MADRSSLFILARDLKQRHLHTLRVLETDVVITPRGQDGLVDQRGTVCERSLYRNVQVRHLERKTDLPAEALSCLQLVNDLCLSFVEKLERRFAHIEDQCFAAVVVPNGGGLETKPLGIKFHQLFIVSGGQSYPQF